MCEIQFIRNFEKEITEEDKKEFLVLMERGSYGNNDAFGYFNSNYKYKRGGEYDERKINMDKLNDNFIVGHNRFATNQFAYNLRLEDGSKAQERNINNHPFKKNNFVMVHNGVIRNNKSIREKYNINTEIVTDSYVILYLVDYFFNLSNKEKRVERIAEAIQQATNELTGYYSVFIYDKEENNLFYFKDNLTKFNFCRVNKNNGETVLCGSTIKSNLKNIYKKYNKEYFKAEDEVIYMINNNVSRNILSKVGFIKEKSKIVRWMEELSLQSKESEFYKTINKIFGFMPDCFINEDNLLSICLKDKVQRKLILNKLSEYLINFADNKKYVLINIEEFYN